MYTQITVYVADWNRDLNLCQSHPSLHMKHWLIYRIIRGRMMCEQTRVCLPNTQFMLHWRNLYWEWIHWLLWYNTNKLTRNHWSWWRTSQGRLKTPVRINNWRLRWKKVLGFLLQSELCQKHSKFRMQFCLHVPNNFLHDFSLKFASFLRY